MYEFVPQKPGPKPKYDWSALYEPGYFFVSCEDQETAKRLRNCVRSAFRNARLTGRVADNLQITTNAGQFRDATGTLQFGVMVKRK